MCYDGKVANLGEATSGETLLRKIKKRLTTNPKMCYINEVAKTSDDKKFAP